MNKPLKMIGIETHAAVPGVAFYEMCETVKRANAADWTAVIQTGVWRAGEYRRELPAGTIIGVKPATGPISATALGAFREALSQNNVAGIDRLLIDFEGFSPDPVTELAPEEFDALARLVGWLRANVGETWWYPTLCAWGSKQTEQRIANMTRLAEFIAALDPKARFFDSELSRPNERDTQIVGRRHSRWSSECAWIRDKLIRRRPLSHACPNSAAWGGESSNAWWPESRLLELLALADRIDRDLWLAVPAGEFAKWVGVVEQLPRATVTA